MRYDRYIIMAAMLAAAVSCNENLAPDSAEELGSPIKFSAGLMTKAFLGSDDINTAGTELTIWGFAGSDALIEGKTAAYNATDGGWNLDKTYHWGGNVNYTFFAWLSKDKDGHSAPAGLTMSGRTLTLPQRAFNLSNDDNDFDFCYSEVVNRPADNADHSTVAFNLKHLYTAIAFSAHNYTGSTIEVKEVRLVGLKNNKSATISFADTGAEVAYGTCSCTWPKSDDDHVPSKTLNTRSFTLAPGAECANIVGVASTTPQYYMFWPQTSEELTAQGWSESARQPSGGAYIKVVYEQDGITFTRYARFPQDNDGTKDLGWPAGTKRKMELSFRDDWFTLQLSAAPWDYSEPDIKYAVDDSELSVESPLQFDESTCTVDEATHTLYFNGANPITGSFKLTSPEGAIWIISKEGDYDAFEVDNVTIGADGLPASRYGDKMDCNYGAVDVTNGNTFTIYPMAVAAGKDYSIQLSFSVRYPNGESYCIDDMLQKDKDDNVVKWTIVFTK